MSDGALEKRTSDEYLARLQQILAARLNTGELLLLCTRLTLDYHALPGEGKVDKTQELVAYLDHHSRIPDIVEIGEQLRPDIY